MGALLATSGMVLALVGVGCLVMAAMLGGAELAILGVLALGAGLVSIGTIVLLERRGRG